MTLRRQQVEKLLEDDLLDGYEPDIEKLLAFAAQVERETYLKVANDLRAGWTDAWNQPLHGLESIAEHFEAQARAALTPPREEER